MSSEVSTSDRIMVAISGENAAAQVYGKGTYRIANPLKEFSQLVHGDDQLRRLIVDMAKCDAVDSTFMGLLAGMALRYKNRGDLDLILINLSDKVFGSMQTLGLDQLVSFHKIGDCPAALQNVMDLCVRADALEAREESRLETAHIMLEAHETLTDLGEGNKMRFQDVISYLKDRVNRDS